MSALNNNELVNFTGGRPGYSEDWEFLQGQLNDVRRVMLPDFVGGAIVVYGCRVSAAPNEGNPNRIFINAGLVAFQIFDDEVVLIRVDEQHVNDPTTTGAGLSLGFTNGADRAFVPIGGGSAAYQPGDRSYYSVWDASGADLPYLATNKRFLRYLSDIPSGPIGFMAMTDNVAWFDSGTGLGTDIMTGWAVCDGRNGTTDMRGLFVVGGADYFDEVGVVLAAEKMRVRIGKVSDIVTEANFTIGEIPSSGGSAARVNLTAHQLTIPSSGTTDDGAVLWDTATNGSVDGDINGRYIRSYEEDAKLAARFSVMWIKKIA